MQYTQYDRDELIIFLKNYPDSDEYKTRESIAVFIFL